MFGRRIDFCINITDTVISSELKFKLDISGRAEIGKNYHTCVQRILSTFCQNPKSFESLTRDILQEVCCLSFLKVISHL